MNLWILTSITIAGKWYEINKFYVAKGVVIKMNDRWVEYAIRIQSIAQAGLQYGKDKYDKERYEALRNFEKYCGRVGMVT